MINLMQHSRRHLAAVDETYTQHLRFACGTGLTMVAAGGACFIHGLLPFLFDRTGSRTIERLAAQIKERQRPARPQPRYRDLNPTAPYLWG
jgi:hypothetical protein